MLQQVCHVKEPTLLKVISAKHKYEFSALSLVMVKAAIHADSRNIAVVAINKPFQCVKFY
jgi:hypothetical protein